MSFDFTAIRGVIVDMDGVVWREQHALPGAVEFFRYLHNRIPYVFATNNSTRTIDYFLDILAEMGIPASAEQIVSSAVATAAYLVRRYPPGTKIFVVGETGIKTILAAEGFVVSEDSAGQPGIVVVGLDRQLEYQKIKTAAN